jgi:hypothetical protein
VTAEALSPKAPAVAVVEQPWGGAPLVAFGSDPLSQRPPAAAAPAPAQRRALPEPPDVGAIASLVPKLSALLDWLRSDTDVTRALVVDEEGLPLVGSAVGDLGETESLFAATGTVANAMKRLALATPGTLSPDFEGHVGDGPVLQLIGFSAARRAFVVAISRKEPFGAHDIDLVRDTFSAALAGSVLGGSPIAPATARGGSGRSSGET